MNINPLDLLKSAQKIQEQMGNVQERLGTITATGSAGGGMVEIDINGHMEVQGVRVHPDALAENDVEMLQDLIAAAFTDAMKKIRETLNGELGSFMRSMPPGFPGVGFSGVS
jgi:DNA-binding YbaB/EbfC family protein